MISKDFFEALNEICDEKGLDREQIYDAFTKGIANAYKKVEGGASNVKVVFNEEKNELQPYLFYTVVTEEELDPADPSKVTLEEAKKIKKGVKLGDYFEIKKTINLKEDFGRIAVSSIKQILNQEIKRFEREKAFAFFNEHQDEMLTGEVIDIQEQYVQFDLGYNTIASLPKKELGKEDCKVGSRIKLYLSKVEMTPKGPRVYVSRSDKNLIKRVLEEYIPEIKDGTIEILGIAREPGDRSKICVQSIDPNADALGACIGPNGKRIRDVINALGGEEKLDIYEYSQDPAVLIANALKPAEVYKVLFDQKEKQATAVVPNDHFSLAIGKKGQNVRLAVQSSGWKIDIKSVDQAIEEGIDF